MIRTGDDEARSPKYAHVERERRCLVDPAACPPLDRARAVLIEDRYITGTRLRLRRMSDAAGTTSFKLTRKYETADPLARPIVTAYLDAGEHAIFAALPALPVVKRRHPLAANGVTYSVDRFGGSLEGLLLAEIEWPDDTGLRGLPPPPGAIREVSDDIRYQGGSLVVHGIPKEDQWPAS